MTPEIALKIDKNTKKFFAICKKFVTQFGFKFN